MKNLKSLQCIKNYRPKPLTDASHQALGKNLKNFKLKDTHLVYKYSFPTDNYLKILSKMNRIGLLADEMDHHPEWTLQSDSLTIGLSTH